MRGEVIAAKIGLDLDYLRYSYAAALDSDQPRPDQRPRGRDGVRLE
jgi:hypothetical protein